MLRETLEKYICDLKASILDVYPECRIVTCFDEAAINTNLPKPFPIPLISVTVPCNVTNVLIKMNSSSNYFNPEYLFLFSLYVWDTGVKGITFGKSSSRPTLKDILESEVSLYECSLEFREHKQKIVNNNHILYFDMSTDKKEKIDFSNEQTLADLKTKIIKHFSTSREIIKQTEKLQRQDLVKNL